MVALNAESIRHFFNRNLPGCNNPLNLIVLITVDRMIGLVIYVYEPVCGVPVGILVQSH